MKIKTIKILSKAFRKRYKNNFWTSQYYRGRNARAFHGHIKEEQFF